MLLIIPGLLHAAADQGHLDVAKVLVEQYHMNVHERNLAGTSPIFLAAISGRAPLVTYLFAHGASPLEKDSYSNTLTHAAVISDDPPTVRATIAGGAPAGDKNGNGHTPFELAMRQGKKNLWAILLAIHVRSQSTVYPPLNSSGWTYTGRDCERRSRDCSTAVGARWPSSRQGGSQSCPRVGGRQTRDTGFPPTRSNRCSDTTASRSDGSLPLVLVRLVRSDDGVFGA